MSDPYGGHSPPGGGSHGAGGHGSGRGQGRGPTTTIVLGVIVLVLAIAAGVFAVVAMVRTVPLGVLTLSGEPGSDVVVAIDAPGSADVVLAEDVRYSLLVVGRSSSPEPRLSGDVSVTAPDGTVSELRPSTDSFRIGGGSQEANLLAYFEPSIAGPHTVEVPDADRDGTRLFVADIASVGSFVLGIFGGVAGIFVAVALGFVGIALLVGGFVWRSVRSPRSGPPPPTVAPPLY